MRSAWTASCVLLAASILPAQGGDEQGPPALGGGGLQSPLAPPPPQPFIEFTLRVGWRAHDAEQLVLHLDASGTAGSGFLIGLRRFGAHRPVLLTAGTLDARGAWSTDLLLTQDEARALDRTEIVHVVR